MEPTNSGRADQWCQCVSGRYTVERPPLLQHRLAPSSLDGQCQRCPVPLRVKVCGKLVKEVVVENPLPRGGHTHTHTPASTVRKQKRRFISSHLNPGKTPFKHGHAVCSLYHTMAIRPKTSAPMDRHGSQRPPHERASCTAGPSTTGQ